MKYHVRDIVYGSNDGLVTTFAIIAGASGANLPVRVIMIVGGASLIADGFSMAASDFLASRTHRAVARQDDGIDETNDAVSPSPWRSALWTFGGFVGAGMLPLIPYIFAPLRSRGFLLAGLFTVLALFAVGALRTLITDRNWVLAGLEMLLAGGAAAAAAYGTGRAIAALVNGGVSAAI